MLQFLSKLSYVNSPLLSLSRELTTFFSTTRRLHHFSMPFVQLWPFTWCYDFCFLDCGYGYVIELVLRYFPIYIYAPCTSIIRQPSLALRQSNKTLTTYCSYQKSQAHNHVHFWETRQPLRPNTHRLRSRALSRPTPHRLSPLRSLPSQHPIHPWRLRSHHRRSRQVLLQRRRHLLGPTLRPPSPPPNGRILQISRRRPPLPPHPNHRRCLRPRCQICKKLS